MTWETESAPTFETPAQQTAGGLSGDRDTRDPDPHRPTGVRSRSRVNDEVAEHHLHEFLGSPQEERTAFLDDLRPADLQMWNGLISRRTGWGIQRRVEIANAILCSASRDFLERAERLLPVLEPNVFTNYVIRTGSVPSWKDTAHLPLYGPSCAPDVLADINVGTARNCDFHAALAAVALGSPGFIEQHIRENTNGTYSVTFLRENGGEASVTVTDRMPWSAGGYLNARPGRPPSKWAMVYEKAYAQLSGGYALIERREDRSSFSDLTGKAVIERSTDSCDLIEVGRHLDQGEAMIATTWAFPAWVKNVEVLSMHVYAIKSVDARESAPTVTLISPEGQYSFVPPTFEVTRSEWLRYFATVRSASMKQLST
jgi:hypothetical protein